MSKRNVKVRESTEVIPMFKTAELMSKLSGIGSNTIRTLMDQKEIDYIQLGNRRLITDTAMLDWYERNKIRAVFPKAN